jgi:hypothetical protein
MAPQSASYDSTSDLPLETFTNSGSAFSDWNTKADGSGTSYADGASFEFVSNVTLYAQWTPSGDRSVAFDANGGSGTMVAQLATYDAATTLTGDSFYYSGYTFTNWNTEANGSGTSYVNGQTYGFASNIILYAQWTALTPGGPGTVTPDYAGYVLTGSPGGYRAVSAKWTVPTIDDCATVAFSATAEWVGVNGWYGNAANNLYQDGTTSQCWQGHEDSFAWWTDEAQGYYAPSLFAVNPGDLIDAQIYQNAAGDWSYVITDMTSGQSSSGTESFSGTGYSAEWIAEDPGAPETGVGTYVNNGLTPLANFGSLTFSDLGLTLSSGSWNLPTISSAVEMAENGSVVAMPSAITGSGASAAFTVAYDDTN